MIALLLIAQAAAPLLGPIGQQAMPAHGCATYLWSPATRALVAMATAEPGSLRVAIDGGKPVDLARIGDASAEAFGFSARTQYRGGDLTATLDQTIAPRSDLTAGAMVPQATLTLDRPGRDTVILPLGGVIGCATPQG